MKGFKFYLLNLAVLAAILSGFKENVLAQQVFSFTGAVQHYTVPPGVTLIGADVQGARGGLSLLYNYGTPGGGGRVQCKMIVTPGQVLDIYVGGTGAYLMGTCCSSTIVALGGWNGGGNSSYEYYPTGGGGASDIRPSGGTLTDRIVVAGGGGGVGGSSTTTDHGGDGGGLTGNPGLYSNGSTTSYSPTGGSQVAGGVASGNTISAGGLGFGGNAAPYYAGGGGGGYYGGGGGYYYGGGAGGSSYPAADNAIVTNIVHTQGYNKTGDGSITITVLCADPGVISGNFVVCPAQTTTLATTAVNGTWSSSNTSVAKVDSVTGTVTGVSTGTASITYNIKIPCGGISTSSVVTVNALPAPISGNVNACLGQTSALSDATPGGVWNSSSAIATVGLSSGIVTGAALGNATITYKLTSTGCYVTIPQSVNALPTKYIVSGTGSVCLGSAGGVPMTLSQSDVNVLYDIYDSTAKVAGPYLGNGLTTPLSLGAHASIGTNTVLATNIVTGCTSTMLGSAVITPYPLPSANTVYVTGNTPSGGYCTGSAGLNVYLQSSESATSYQLYSGAFAIGAPVAGTGLDIDFGTQPSGTYHVKATSATTGCVNEMANSVTITENPLPGVYNVTGGGSYCAGSAGVRDTLSGSEAGVNYELYLNSSPTGNIKAGTGGIIDFGVLTAPGNYTVVATNGTTACSGTMSGTASILMNALPTPFNISTGGHYCSGGTGTHITLGNSDLGIDYQLYDGSGPVAGGNISGTGANLDFGVHLTGKYYVVATNHSTVCQNNMTGVDSIYTDNLPSPYLVTGGGHYCANGSGVPVRLDGSDINTSYQLYLNSSPAGAPFAGTGSDFSFGIQAAPGTYTVSAHNTLTGCDNNMSGLTTIIIDSLPDADTLNVTNGGNYCAGGAGVIISLDNSSSNSTYRLYRNGIALTDDSAMVSGSSTGSSISFGMRKDTGNYTITAVNTATCTAKMTGSAQVAINPLPTAFTITGGGAYCIGGTANNIMLSFSESGVNYKLYNAGGIVDSVSGTGSTLDFGVRSAIGNYTITGINSSTGCIAGMAGSVNVSTTSLPTAYNVTGGGNYCSGTPGAHVYSSASNTGIDYQLYNGTVPMGGAIHGTGHVLDFGLQTISGNYTIIATNTASFCTKNMNGSVNVTAVPAPDEYVVTGGGNYCAGGTGKSIGLANSDTGVKYQLWKGTTMIDTAIAGTGSPLDFGVKSAVGAYTIKGINTSAGCITEMSGNAVITLDPLPAQYTVSGGGSVCAGGSGSHVYLSGSNAGVVYNLNNSVLGTVASTPGTGLNIDFGAQASGGTYTVVAVNTTTHCPADMTASAIVNIIPLPAVHTVIGGGSYCAGGAGIDIKLDSSESGITYQLYNGAAAVGFPAWGIGDSLDLGVQSAAGTYTVKATNPATGCSGIMDSNAVITINPVLTPSVTITSTEPSIVCEGTLVTYIANPVGGGTAPVYEWHAITGTKDSLISSVTDTMMYIPGVTGEKIKVIMVSNAACTAADATASVFMTVHPNGTPSVAISSAPGLSVCPGSAVTLSAATPAFGGTAPTFKWMKNGSTTVLSTSSAYSYVPANNDKITLEMRSNEQCRTADSAVSSVTLTLQTVPVPVFTIESNIAAAGGIGIGQSVTLKAVITANAGTAQSYQWILNGTPLLGATADTLVSDHFFNSDSIACVVTATGNCGDVSASAYKIMSVHNLGAGSAAATTAAISLMPNPNKGTFTIKGTLGASVEEASFEITNMLGQVIYQDKASVQAGQINKQIRLNGNLANGMYLLNVRTENGNSTFHFVIEN